MTRTELIFHYSKCVLTGLSTIKETRVCPYNKTTEEFNKLKRKEDSDYCFSLAETMADEFLKRYPTKEENTREMAF